MKVFTTTHAERAHYGANHDQIGGVIVTSVRSGFSGGFPFAAASAARRSCAFFFGLAFSGLLRAAFSKPFASRNARRGFAGCARP